MKQLLTLPILLICLSVAAVDDPRGPSRNLTAPSPKALAIAKLAETVGAENAEMVYECLDDAQKRELFGEPPRIQSKVTQLNTTGHKVSDFIPKDTVDGLRNRLKTEAGDEPYRTQRESFAIALYAQEQGIKPEDALILYDFLPKRDKRAFEVKANTKRQLNIQPPVVVSPPSPVETLVGEAAEEDLTDLEVLERSPFKPIQLNTPDPGSKKKIELILAYMAEKENCNRPGRAIETLVGMSPKELKDLLENIPVGWQPVDGKIPLLESYLPEEGEDKGKERMPSPFEPSGVNIETNTRDLEVSDFIPNSMSNLLREQLQTKTYKPTLTQFEPIQDNMIGFTSEEQIERVLAYMTEQQSKNGNNTNIRPVETLVFASGKEQVKLLELVPKDWQPVGKILPLSSYLTEEEYRLFMAPPIQPQPSGPITIIERPEYNSNGLAVALEEEQVQDRSFKIRTNRSRSRNQRTLWPTTHISSSQITDENRELIIQHLYTIFLSTSRASIELEYKNLSHEQKMDTLKSLRTLPGTSSNNKGKERLEDITPFA